MFQKIRVVVINLCLGIARQCDFVTSFFFRGCLVTSGQHLGFDPLEYLGEIGGLYDILALKFDNVE